MRDRVTIAGQVPVNDRGIALVDPFPSRRAGGVRAALRPDAVRPGLKVGLAEGVPDDLDRRWCHAVPDAGDAQGAAFPVRCRKVAPPHRWRPIGPRWQRLLEVR